MTRAPLSQAIAVLLLFCGAATAGATTRTVTSLNDSGAGTLRDTLAASQDGDTINFSVTGQIKLTSGQLTVSKSITIAGPGSNVLEVTRTSGVFRIFTITQGLTVTISSIAITNGHSPDSIDADFPRGAGGGIFQNGGSLTINNCLLSGNTADYLGGGIETEFKNTLTVLNSTFTNNSTVSSPSDVCGGGAIAILDGKGSLQNCTFAGNIVTTNATPPPFRGGGAIFNDFSSLSVTNCTFTDNSATGIPGGFGGAIYNTVSEGGHGGVATVTVTHCTFSGNAAPAGGGITNQGASSGNAFVTLRNNIFFSTANTPGANLFNTGDGAAITSSGFNLSSDDGAGFLTNTGDQKNTDPKLGPLQENGGPTQTMALLPGSPAQDKGNSFNVSTDQRGLGRPKDIPGIANAAGGDGSDIGAVEMDFAPPLIVTTTADHDDGNCNAIDCTLREAINAANATPGANTILFNNNAIGTITLGTTLGPLNVTDSTTIIGPGARILSVSGSAGGQVFRVFNFNAGVSTVYGLTIRDGSQVGGANTSAGGAGVFNATNAFLTFNDCAFLLNNAHAGDSSTSGGTGAAAQGGAILNAGTLTLNRCTFSNNSAVGGRGGDAPGGNGGNVHGGNGGDAQGGAVFNDTSATLTINNSTFSGNGATAGGGGNGQQFGGNGGTATGAIVNLGAMTVTAATLTSNTGSGGAGGSGNNPFNGGSSGTGNGALSAVSGTSTIRNTISANNSGNHGGGADVNGTFASNGYNLIGIGDSSTGFGVTGDQVGTAAAPIDAMLGSLLDYGGPTNTHALLTNSPAIDRGQAFGLATDQRGFSRTAGTANVSGGDGTDIGAFEVQAPPTPTPTATPSATPTATPASGSLGNVSTRLQVGTGNNVLFAGFIIQGSGSKTLLIRSAGPSLASFGVPGVLSNPQLELHDVNNTIGTNDNWQTTQIGGVITSDQVAAIQNSGAVPTDPAEPALIATLPAGQYSAIVQGVGGTQGVATVEVYDLSPNNGAILANISTRGFIQTGDNVMIGGFIVVAQSSKVLIRATGPSLIPFGITNALADPRLELHDVNGTLAGNDDWQTTQLGGIITSDQSAAIQNSGLAPGNSAESTIIATLAPGNYTAIAQGVNGGTGVGLVEVFALP